MELEVKHHEGKSSENHLMSDIYNIIHGISISYTLMPQLIVS